MRLDKLLAHCGYGSRKDVKKYIRSGEVLVNGEVILDDDYKVNEEVDEIIVFDESVSYQNKVYIMLNKPKNVVSATFDNKAKTVIDLLSQYKNYKIFPIGRLDIDTTGLLLVSNDGALCHKLLSPKNHVDKKYLVEFDGDFKQSYYNDFEMGIILDDGYKTLPSHIEIIDEKKAIVTIHEGKFHQVKRMFLALNMKVINLKRIEFGPLVLDESLKEGEYRLLNKEEISILTSL
ncbi:MAG: rRNA pseudouridine synthase [Erysipelotrichaceae bacterium]|nr:rRNA pseudouridine synthase [Erysipelotrichaceae bacterium]